MPEITRAIRIDKAKITGKLSRTPEGYLLGDAIVARTGILEYMENGRVVKELVTNDELANPESIATIKMKPLTNGHPSVKMLDAKTVKQYQVGHTGENARVDSGLLVVPLTITDADAVRSVENGRRELSAGYNVDLVEEPGIWEGQRYDRIQLRRTYNHVAVCDLSRAGDVTTMHLDSADICECGTPDFKEPQSNNLSTGTPPKTRSDRMVKYKVDGLEYDAAPEVVKHIEKLDAANTQHKTVLDAMTAERDSWKDRAEKSDGELKKLPELVACAVKARSELERKSLPHLDQDKASKIGDMSSDEIKSAVIIKAFPKADLKDASEAYIQARFDAAIDVLSVAKDDSAMVNQRIATNGSPDTKSDCSDKKVKSKEDADEEVRNRYKKTSNRDQLLK